MDNKRLYVIGGVAVVAGIGLYFWKRSSRLGDFGKVCVEFKAGDRWLEGRCYVDPERAKQDVKNLRSVGYESRVVEK